MRMKQLPSNTKKGLNIKRKKLIAVMVLTFLLAFLMTGCQAISETFGKEYRMIDNFYEQLEADVRFTFEEFAATQNLSTDQKSNMDTQLDILTADMKIAKANMKLMIRTFEENKDALGGGDSIEAYLEKALLETRLEMETEVTENTNGQLVLKSTVVDRGFLGSIWHFIRNNWLISLIILGVLGTIMDKFEEIRDRFYKKKRGSNE